LAKHYSQFVQCLQCVALKGFLLGGKPDEQSLVVGERGNVFGCPAGLCAAVIQFMMTCWETREEIYALILIYYFMDDLWSLVFDVSGTVKTKEKPAFLLSDFHVITRPTA
jgi:hypothetical protein